MTFELLSFHLRTISGVCVCVCFLGEGGGGGAEGFKILLPLNDSRQLEGGGSGRLQGSQFHKARITSEHLPVKIISTRRLEFLLA